MARADARVPGLRVLGVGGTGVVFRVEDLQLMRPVALKVMLPGLAAKAALGSASCARRGRRRRSSTITSSPSTTSARIAACPSWQWNSWKASRSMRAWFWAGGVFKLKTKDGTIVMEDLPVGVQMIVDGQTLRIERIGGGQTLVSSARDGTIRVWNPARPWAREVIALGPANQRLVIDLDPSGTYVAAGGADAVIYVLRLP